MAADSPAPVPIFLLSIQQASSDSSSDKESGGEEAEVMLTEVSTMVLYDLLGERMLPL